MLSTYRNGEIPARLLVRRENFLLTAGTWAKFDDLVARVKRRTGVTLRITDVVNGLKGVGAYRDRPLQRAIKAYYTSIGKSWQAAAEGTSSHGGEYKGADALAIDITNYGQVPLHVFFEEGRNAGFQMGYFDGREGRPYEPWHIIDRNPYRVVGAPASKPNTTSPESPEEDEEDVKIKFGHRSDGGNEWMIVHPSLKDGYQVTTDQKRAIAWARLYGRGWSSDESVRYDFNVPRADYIELQAAAKAASAGWRA